MKKCGFSETGAEGKIQQLLALEHGSGRIRLHYCLSVSLEKVIELRG